MAFDAFVNQNSKFKAGDVRKALDGFQSWAPWVKVKFSAGDQLLTVGNDSNLPENAAVIKSFQYSCKTEKGGITCEIEIHDTQGGSFEDFFKRINKFNNQIASDYEMEVEFGWVGLDCNGNVSKPTAGGCLAGSANSLKTPILRFLPLNVSTNYEGGKIKFTIEGVDLIQRVIETREDLPKGSNTSQGKKLSMRQAIIQMFDDRGIKVKFQRKNEDGVLLDEGFKPVANSRPDGLGPNRNSHGGAQAVYHPKNNDAFRAATEWLRSARSATNETSFVPLWDICESEPTLIFLASPKPECICSYSEGKSLGTYIVNGGGESPVISFSPKVKWVYNNANPAGGSAPGPQSGEPVDLSNFKDCDTQEGTGMQITSISTETATNQHGRDSNIESAKDAHLLTRAWVQNDAITCQLTVQGDPSFYSPVHLVGRSFAIMVVNPYHYVKKDGADISDCGEWLSNPVVNPIYSNKNWIIQGCTHQIKEGSYQTMFDMHLPAPGIDISSQEATGCSGSGGKTI